MGLDPVKSTTVKILISTGYHPFPEDSPTTYTYNGPGSSIDTITKTWEGLTYKKTFTYTGTDITADSGWVKQ